jgi:hypothetical protein
VVTRSVAVVNHLLSDHFFPDSISGRETLSHPRAIEITSLIPVLSQDG